MRLMQAVGWILIAASPLGAQATYSPNVTPTDVQAALQTQVQAATAVTQGDGSFAGTWPTPFGAQPTSYIAGITSTTNTPLVCSIQSADATSFSGKCWQLSPTTLPGTATALLGLVISPITNAAAGQTVRVFGKQ